MKILFLLFFSVSPAEDIYFVSFSNQTVFFANNQQPLQVGDKITGEEELIFKNEFALAGVVSPTKGRFRVLGSKSVFHTTAEYRSKLKNVLAPAIPPKKNISDEEFTHLSALKRHFHTDSTGRYLCIESEKIPLPDNIFHLGENHYFFIKYWYRGQFLTKKLPAIVHPAKADTLILDNTIYMYENRVIKPEDVKDVQLYFEDNVRKQITLVGKIKPVFMQEEALLPELKVLYRELKKLYPSDKLKIKAEITAHLTEFYGKPNETILNELMKKVE